MIGGDTFNEDLPEEEEMVEFHRHRLSKQGPCYICGANVPPHAGWHQKDDAGVPRHWCQDHQPVWSRA